MKKKLTLSLSFFALLPWVSHGMVANPNTVFEKQPSGKTIELKFNGNEELSWHEDVNGYPVVRLGEQYVYQTNVNPLFQRRSSLVVGEVDPEAHGVKKITPAQRLPYLQPSEFHENHAHVTDARASVSAVTTTGTLKNLVVLIRFQNHQSRSLPSQSDYNTFFNTTGGDPVLAPTGSVKDIYLENSYGQLTINSTVSDWITVSGTEQSYANGNSGLSSAIWPAITEALDQLDTTVDFTQFDADSDGVIDAITVIHSGYGAEWGGTDSSGTYYTNRIWSHKWAIQPSWNSADGVSVGNYNINPGLWATSGSNIGRVGVVTHELGHFLGLPDFYDTDGTSSGIGSWGLMANSWGFLGDQLNPPHMSAWSKIELGWVTPQTLTSNGTYTANQVEFNQEIFRIDEGFPANEYLLIENRQPVGIESSMPQGGLAIWHIDETKSNNRDEGYPGHANWPYNHYKIALLQADGLYELEKKIGRGNGGDVYHAGGVDAIDGTTLPSTDSYQFGNTAPSNVSITNISTSSSSMTFDYMNGTVALCNGQAVTVDLGEGQQPTNGPDVILGTPGDDVINGMAGDDAICGGDGNDFINGGGGADSILGEGGDDLLLGTGGNDYINGGDGNDYIYGGTGDDYLNGESGDDFLSGQGGNDYLIGDTGVDDLRGGPGNDTLDTGSGATVGTGKYAAGGGGSDQIFGSSDDDDLRGSAGIDYIVGGGGNDIIKAGNGADYIVGGPGDDILYGEGARDEVFGSDGNDTLFGGVGKDNLYGDAGNDTLSGQGDEDNLVGGEGLDNCTGGSAIDTYQTCETIVGGPN